MKYSAFYLQLWLLGILLNVPSVHAIDPLPPQIEAAPDDVKQAYIQRTAQQSQREKLAIGQQRFQRRTEYKRTLVNHLRQDAEARRAAIESDLSVDNGAVQDTPSTKSLVKLCLISMVLISGVLAVGYRFLRRARPSGA